MTGCEGPRFPTPRDEYGWASDGGDDVRPALRVLPITGPPPPVVVPVQGEPARRGS